MKSNKISKKYILYWASQSVSQMGSAMSGYALTIWAYCQTHTAISVFFLTFCYYVPYVVISSLAGSIIDRHRKKAIILLSDAAAAFCTLSASFLWNTGNLQLWHIYFINGIIGIMNAFQAPAESVVIGLLVPSEIQARAIKQMDNQ